jgi:hypothetical protein
MASLSTFFSTFTDSKIKVIYESLDMKLGESVTLNQMIEDSRIMPENTRILYLHSKGVRHKQDNKCIRDWINYMMYFNVECWRDCQIGLDLYETIGVNLINQISIDTNKYKEIDWHYSGNFWWARASYIATLEECSRELYHAPEMWVCSKTKNCGCFFQSNKHHYIQEFPENLYRDR